MLVVVLMTLLELVGQKVKLHLIEIDKWTDSKGALKEIDTDKQVKVQKVEAEKILNPLNGKFALKDYAESFTDVQTYQKVFQDKFTII